MKQFSGDLGKYRINRAREALDEAQLMREQSSFCAAIGKLLQVSPGTVQRDLTKLQLDGILVHQGPDKGGWWELMRP